MNKNCFSHHQRREHFAVPGPYGGRQLVEQRQYKPSRARYATRKTPVSDIGTSHLVKCLKQRVLISEKLYFSMCQVEDQCKSGGQIKDEWLLFTIHIKGLPESTILGGGLLWGGGYC